jgi:poly(3-hydroxybutyrate) depolymerase
VTGVPGLLPCSVRKAAFRIAAPAATAPGSSRLLVRLLDENGGELDRVERDLPVRERSANRRVTFRSGIDGSVQFYGWLPARRDSTFPVPALVLSLHGAAVDAHAQSGSYASKSWAHVAAPTNRRPFGYNWEDWGRLDALEVLEHVRARHRFDPDRVYLTGHSMGGHGTWHLGVLHPDLFAAVGPSAGWISFWSYRPERAIEPATEVERLLVRATAPSRTLDLADNLAELGVYVLHGDADDNVPVEQARLMARRLGGFHRDWVLHEQEEAGHWWDDGEEPGAACVDWPPMFDFFARHARGGTQRASAARFVTPDPGVSSTFRWVTVEAQSRALLVSRVDLRAEPHLRRITGSTENVARLSLSTEALAGEGPLRVTLDGDSLFANPEGGRVTLARGPRGWTPVPPAPASQKGPHRAGTFKDAFRNRVLFVAGTAGDEAEDARALAKARFDAEQFWYDGNGSVDVVTDVAFDPASEPDRNVVLYGNASTNRAWRALLADSPVQVSSGEVRVGSRRWRGPDLGVLLIRPRPGSEVASVAAVAASGPAGARLLERRPYLSPGFAFPDVTVFRAPRRAEAAGVAIAAGYFGNDWSLETGELVTE